MKFFKVVLLALVMGVVLGGCSGSWDGWKYKECVEFGCEDYSSIPYVGTVQQIVGNKVVFLCYTIDFESAVSFQVGDIVYFEYEIRDGSLCEPDDLSRYRVYTVPDPSSDAPFNRVEESVEGERIRSNVSSPLSQGETEGMRVYKAGFVMEEPGGGDALWVVILFGLMGWAIFLVVDMLSFGRSSQAISPVYEYMKVNGLPVVGGLVISLIVSVLLYYDGVEIVGWLVGNSIPDGVEISINRLALFAGLFNQTVVSYLRKIIKPIPFEE